MSTNTPRDLDDALLGRYVAGACSAVDQATVEAWCSADDRHRERLQALQVVWDQGQRATMSTELDAIWGQLSHTLGVASTAPTPLRTPPFATPITRRVAPSWRAWMAAAAVVIVTIAAIVHQAWRPSMQEYATAAGERVQVTLPDGTRFVLAPGSRLRVGRHYGEVRRDIELMGEATFDVVHNAAHPFAVHMGTTVLQDIGTRFDARRYPEDEGVSVTVAEGAVEVGSTLLHAGDAALVRSTGVAVQHQADTADVLSWATGTIHFDNVPLSAVARGLSRWYALDIRVADTALAARHVSVTFKSETPTEALDVINLLVRTRAVRNGSRVTLYPSTNQTP